MNQRSTQGIVLSRTNYGEADRIIKLLTPDMGKISVMARGVRKPKSKLAGGIELFSISNITFIAGRGDLGTLMSARLDTHYGEIVKQIDRVQLGYELIKQLDRATEDELEADYFNLLHNAFMALNDRAVALDIIRTWMGAQLLRLNGGAPNLITDGSGAPLSADATFTFDIEAMVCNPSEQGRLTAAHVKVLRVLFSEASPLIIARIAGIGTLLPTIKPLVEAMSAQIA